MLDAFRPRPAHLALLLLVASLLRAGPAAAEPVAITFDDLPTLQLTESAAYAQRTTALLTGKLQARHIPTIGFVVGEKFASRPAVRDAMLRAWSRTGLALGNHTYSHVSLNRVSLDLYLADIARDEPLLPARRGVRWFRPPYLEAGATAQAASGLDAWLVQHGYRLAPVSLVTDDDQFALPYDEAVLAHDQTRVRAIRAAYLAHAEARVGWYRQAGLALLGRRPSLVMLLHASRLNADVLDDLLAILRRHELTPVPLAVAMRDPAYRIPVAPDADGDDWLNRWAATLGRELPWDSYPEPPADIVAASARLDTAP